MKATRIAAGMILALVTANWVSGAAPAGEADNWSVHTNGLQARLTLVEKPKLNGTRWLVPIPGVAERQRPWPSHGDSVRRPPPED